MQKFLFVYFSSLIFIVTILIPYSIIKSVVIHRAFFWKTQVDLKEKYIYNVEINYCQKLSSGHILYLIYIQCVWDAKAKMIS